MSARDRIILAISIAACACVVGYWVLLRPSSARLAQSKQALAKMNEQLGDAVRLRRTGVEDTLHKAGMWTADESSVFLRELAQLAAAHGTRLVSVTVADPRRLNEQQPGSASTTDYGLFEMKVSAKFQGVYPAIRGVLVALHDHHPQLFLTEVSLATEGSTADEIAATTDMKYFVFQRAAGSRPAGPTPALAAAGETVALTPTVPTTPSPFGAGPAPPEPEKPAGGKGPVLPTAMTLPPVLPEVEVEEPEEPEPVGPTPVLTGIVGQEGQLLAAITVEGRTRLYAAGDALAGNVRLTAVAPDGIQVRVTGVRRERTVLARTGQPITGVHLVLEELPAPGGIESPAPYALTLPQSAGTVNGPAGAVGLIRENGRTYVAKVGDVVGGRLQIVAIENGNVFVTDVGAGSRSPGKRIALPSGSGTGSDLRH